MAPSDMPATITEYILNPSTYPNVVGDESILATDENALTYLISLLRRRFEIDFTRYKHHTLFRRLDARLQMAKAENLSAYIRFLQDNTEEQNALYRDLLIDVTAFFRDRDAFAVIEKEVVPTLVDLKEAGETIRIWVAACATGEEAYSLAILFLEEIEKQGKEIELKVFATDAHQDSIAKASAGIYSHNRLQAVNRDLFEKYFRLAETQQDEFQIVKEVRSKVVFATHNLLENPHFSQLDMISCRNLLIYFDDEAQEELLSRFHIGLRKGGYLFLGSSEHLKQTAADYRIVSTQWRIFQKVDNRTKPEIKDRSDLVNRLPQHLQKQAQLSGYRNWETRLLQRLIQIGYVVDGQGNLKEVYGEGRKLLQFKAGRAALTLTNLLPDSLAIPVRTGLQTAQQEDREVRFDAIDLGGDQFDVFATSLVAISIIPFQGSSIELGNSGKYYLISIEPLDQAGYQHADMLDSPQTSVRRNTTSPSDITKIQSLEQELTFTRESLQ
ncbi:MAG: protein-glutamate O-methyltransferase CheR, partial [Chloroflexota bacterium]